MFQQDCSAYTPSPRLAHKPDPRGERLPGLSGKPLHCQDKTVGLHLRLFPHYVNYKLCVLITTEAFVNSLNYIIICQLAVQI